MQSYQLEPLYLQFSEKIKALGFNQGTVSLSTTYARITVEIFSVPFPEGFFQEAYEDKRLWVSQPIPRAEGSGYEVIIEENLLDKFEGCHPDIQEVILEQHPMGIRIRGGNFQLGMCYCSLEQGKEIAQRVFPNVPQSYKTVRYESYSLDKVGPWNL